MKYKTITILPVVLLLAALVCMGACVKASPQPGGQQLSIQSLTPVQSQTTPGGTVAIESSIINPGNSALNYKWSSTGGGFGSSGQNNIWQAPAQPGVYEITLTVDDGKGATAQSRTSVTVSNNRAPVIIKLSSERDAVTPGGSTAIICSASDPDGDNLRYSWTAADGSISGKDDRVSWISPNKVGDIAITCVVSDSKGGEAKQSVLVKVVPTSGTITINLVRTESGTVSSNGDKDTNRLRAGDDDRNVAYRAFLSYDIFSLNKTNVREAKLKFGPASIAGDPFSALGGLRLWKVSYGEGLPDYDITGDTLFAAGAVFSSSPREVDVTNEIRSLAAAGASRLQLEALFIKGSNGSKVGDFIEWPDVTLAITFAPY
jgi:hypothetical protein